MTGGSRTTFATGLAAYEAAQDAVRQLKERAAKLWEIAPEDVDWIDGKAVSKKNGVPPMTLKDLARKLTPHRRTHHRTRQRPPDRRRPHLCRLPG